MIYPGFGASDALEPTHKADPHAPRVCSPEETVARVLSCADKIPLTRLADLTPLDRGGAPVWCAVTPLARDLTTHLGKGRDAAAARASALMEAVERVSAETAQEVPVRSRRDDLAGAFDPRRYELPGDTGWTPDTEIGWLPARCLLAGTHLWLPADLTLSPPDDGVIHQPDTNGLAAGNTLTEAILHALCEVVERDAAGQRLFCDLYGDPLEGPPLRRLALDDLPESTAQLRRDLEIEGRRVYLDDLTSDIAVPVVRAYLVDPAYPGNDGPHERAFVGYGCDPSAQIAISRALTEAAQSRVAVVQGARDSFNDSLVAVRPAARAAMHAPLEPGPLYAPDSLPDFESPDLAQDLEWVLAALRRAGVAGVHVSDLTRADIGVPVVRVRVPGLTSFLVDRSRHGWRCRRWLL